MQKKTLKLCVIHHTYKNFELNIILLKFARWIFSWYFGVNWRFPSNRSTLHSYACRTIITRGFSLVRHWYSWIEWIDWVSRSRNRTVSHATEQLPMIGSTEPIMCGLQTVWISSVIDRPTIRAHRPGQHASTRGRLLIPMLMDFPLIVTPLDPIGGWLDRRGLQGNCKPQRPADNHGQTTRVSRRAYRNTLVVWPWRIRHGGDSHGISCTSNMIRMVVKWTNLWMVLTVKYDSTLVRNEFGKPFYWRNHHNHFTTEIE